VKLLKMTIVTTFAVSGILAGLSAQQAGFKRTVLQQSKLSVPGRESVTAVAEFQPGATVGHHTHPGEEIGYILEGMVVIEREGAAGGARPGEDLFHSGGHHSQRHQQDVDSGPRSRQLHRRIREAARHAGRDKVIPRGVQPRTARDI
jgi:hypothetical protein